MVQSSDSREKLRKEFKAVIVDPAIAEDPSLLVNVSKTAFLDKVVTLEASQEVEFATRLMQEGLRMRPSTAVSSIYIPTKQMKLGKYIFQKDDMLMIYF